MAIDSEPKDGDFARYIENLNRAGGSTPGQVSGKRGSARQTSGTASIPQSITPPAGEPLSTAPWGKAAPPPMQSRKTTASAPAYAPAPGEQDAGTVSLAKRGRQRKLGIVLTIAGMMAGWAAVRIAFQALRAPHVNLDELMPAVFLAFFAFMLFKAASGARNPKKSALEKLPPLTTTAYRKDGGR